MTTHKSDCSITFATDGVTGEPICDCGAWGKPMTTPETAAGRKPGVYPTKDGIEVVMSLEESASYLEDMYPDEIELLVTKARADAEREIERLRAALQTEGVRRIAAERERQIEDEGYTAEHDAREAVDDLARAGACYALPEAERQYFPHHWPWNPEYWKPTPNDRIRELVKAGALVAAEIDSLLREQTR
jgi:hypothetical protein